jgi:hypothetical protein
LKAVLSKEMAEHIEMCKQCRNLISIKCGKLVEVECSAVDRFDCPYLLKIFYPKIYALQEKERMELVGRIRSRRLSAEDSKYFS